MTEFQRRLNKAMNDNNIIQADLVRLTGIQKARISQYLSGYAQPKHETAKLLAKALHVSEGWLMGYDVEMEINPTIHQLAMQSDELLQRGKKVPLLGQIACGIPILAEQNIEEYIYCADPNVDFAIRAKGDSMIGKRIYDGDIIFIKKTPEVENGEIAAVLIGNEATLKIVNFNKEQNVLTLISANNDFQPMIYIGDQIKEVKILGKALSFQGVIR